MSFQILPLKREDFSHYFEKTDNELADIKACRIKATSKPGFPCRVSLQDAEMDENLILLNYEHVSGASPYASNYAIYIRENAETATPEPGDIPDFFKGRTLSVRSFTKENRLRGYRVVDGLSLADAIAELFADPGADEIHIHHAGPGCYAARAIRK